MIQILSSYGIKRDDFSEILLLLKIFYLSGRLKLLVTREHSMCYRFQIFRDFSAQRLGRTAGPGRGRPS